MISIAVSLWSVPPVSRAAEAARLVTGGVTRFHWDSADGSMSRAGGFTAQQARTLAPAGTRSDAHLILHDPRPVIDAWASWCESIAVHASRPHWRESLALVAAAGALPVLAVTTHAELLSAPTEWGVLVMSIVPGEAGSAFDERSLALVEHAAARGHRSIGVDGSITPARARRLTSAGATILISGSSLTGAAEPRAWLREAGAP